MLLAVTLGIGQSQDAKLPRSPSDVLVIHDSVPGPLPSGLVDGNNILDLLGHFGLKGDLVSLEEYKAGDMARYRFVIVLGVDDRNPRYPLHLLADARAASMPIFWIFKHVDELLSDPSFAAKLGFRTGHSGMLEGFRSVSYKGISVLKPEEESLVFPLEILDASKVKVLARAEAGNGRTEPYVIRSGNFWYCADSPFAFVAEGDRYWVFCDLLHDFLNVPHQEDRKALLRLEDISAQDDPENLRDLADYLNRRGIPFQVSLIPIYRDPANNEEIYLSDRPAFVRAIRYMVSKGGLVVMHGVTHQYRGKSGDDFEFWDSLSDKPIQGDSKTLVEQKLRLGLEECFKNGIYPVTWETPHYMASSLDYQTIARYFNSSYERVASFNRGETGHHFPYPSVDRYGRFIIPESLGFISLENPDPDSLVQSSARLKIVRDGVASFFFHPFLEREYLTRVLDGIEANGYSFISINDYDCRVQMNDRLVQTYTDTVNLPIHGRYLRRFFMDSTGRISGESYSDRPLDTTVTDPGVVPPDAILVMEGVPEIHPQKEAPEPTLWESISTWLKQRFTSKAPEASALTQPEVVVLWDDGLRQADWNNQQSYAQAFRVYGFRVSTRKWKDFSTSSIDKETIVAVPQAAAERLSAKQNEDIDEFVRRGGRLVLDGSSPLSLSLGVTHEKRSLKIREVDEKLYGNISMTWKPPADVDRFTIKDPLVVYAQDSESELPLATLARFGSGRFLYLGARLDPNTPLGYSRLPYFVQYAKEGFYLKLPFQTPQLELYFDPSFREATAIENLAELWRRVGVRVIYAAAYQFYPTWSYNYQRLIDVCHKNGILVYAWLELPHVSKKFWDDHPEWRARTATGEDGKVGWRYHMDLDNPDCREAAFSFVEELLKKYAWDGVNIAELNYDTGQGPEDPKSYLPMGAPARSAFRALNGFDPVLLFDRKSPYYWKKDPAALKKFESYRSQRVLDWHKALLERLTPQAQERDMEIVVTMLDSLHSRTLTRDTGVESRQIVSLMSQFPFTLQVEDPAHLWADSPERYKRFTDAYLRLVPDKRRLMFDINVVPDRDVSHSVSPVPLLVGVELADSLHLASQACGRAAIYSESTIPFEDLQMLSRVLGNDTRVERRWSTWVTKSEKPVLLNAPGPWQRFLVDGKVWPGWGDNEILLPAGSHEISASESRFRLVDRSILDIRLMRFTGNLDSLIPTHRGLEFGYDSDLRTIALFNRRPFEVRVDGTRIEETPAFTSGLWSVRLPRGQHRVEVLADSAAYVILDTASLYSSTLIVIFGSVATGVMALFYLAILSRRAFKRAVGGKSAP